MEDERNQKQDSVHTDDLRDHQNRYSNCSAWYLSLIHILVHPEATKAQVKEAVEKMFEGAKVAAVNTMNYSGKPKRRGYIFGKTKKFKKAVVKLAADSKDIEIFQGM